MHQVPPQHLTDCIAAFKVVKCTGLWPGERVLYSGVSWMKRNMAESSPTMPRGELIQEILDLQQDVYDATLDVLRLEAHERALKDELRTLKAFKAQHQMTQAAGTSRAGRPSHK